jgi:hypothetical protein
LLDIRLQDPQSNNNQKNLHTSGRAELITRAKISHIGSKGCRDPLMILKAIYDDCRRKIKNLSRPVAWIDYQQAFDSVPHSWVDKSIELVGVKSRFVKFCKSSIEILSTTLS